MNTLACIKRVPDTGASIILTEDQQRIDASSIGYTMSPHEECAIEAAVQLVEAHGGTSTVLTLGPDEATEQLRTGLAMRADEAVLLETDGEEWDPIGTARAIAAAIRDLETEYGPFDVMLFGNESADQENYQVGVRVAYELDRPCIAGIKDLESDGETATAYREIPGGTEVYDLELPAIIAVKEGLNAPRYPSMRSKMQARRQKVTRIEPMYDGGGLEMINLVAPIQEDAPAEILGDGPAAVPGTIDVLDDLGVL